MTAADKLAMKRYFQAAKSWDRQRRLRLRGQPNDPQANGRTLDVLLEQGRRVHQGPFIDDAREDAAEARLAHVLSQRTTDTQGG